MLALRELATQAGVAPEAALQRLQAAGFREVTLDSQVQTIADARSLTPAQVYGLIQEPGASSSARRGTHGAGAGEGGKAGGGGGAGGGPGWKTLAQFCADEGIDLAAAQARLANRGIQGYSGQTLREIAVKHGFDRPYALLEILRQK